MPGFMPGIHVFSLLLDTGLARLRSRAGMDAHVIKRTSCLFFAFLYFFLLRDWHFFVFVQVVVVTDKVFRRTSP